MLLIDTDSNWQKVRPDFHNKLMNECTVNIDASFIIVTHTHTLQENLICICLCMYRP